MAIASIDELIDALGNHSQRMRFEKLQVSGTVSNRAVSTWRVAGIPGAGSTPSGAAAVACTSADVGAVTFANAASGKTMYIGAFRLGCSSSIDFEIHDRLAHCGGLSGATATTQPITDFDVTTLSGLAANRLGESDLSDVQWWIEWITTTGASNISWSVDVTYTDNTTETISLGALGASITTHSMFPIRPATAGKWIKAVTALKLSATTGTAGNVGIVATRARAAANTSIGGRMEIYDWAQLGLPPIPDDSALFGIATPFSTVLPAIRGGGKLCEG